MRILYLQDKFDVGGINRITSVKENYLAEHGFEVHNLNTAEELIIPKESMYSDKIHFHYIYKEKRDRLLAVPIIGRLLQYIYLRFCFLKVYCKVRPDIIVSTMPTLEPLAVIYLTIWIKRIIEFQGLYCGTRIGQLSRLGKWYSLTKYRICRIVSLTSREAKHVEELTGCHSLYVNNANYMRSDLQAQCIEKNVLIVSRLSYEKGIADFLPSWKRVEVSHPDWHLNIYGCGPEEARIRETIQSQGLKNVSIYPYTNDIESVYLNSSIMILPSIFEGWGLTLIESMSLGVPCVAYDCPFGPSDIIRDEEDGFLAKYLDGDDMAEKINYLIEHPDIRKQMGAKARVNVRRFDVPVIMEKWVTLFNNLKKGIFKQP